MNEKNNKDTDQAIINTLKNNMGDKVTIHDIDKKHCLEKHKLNNNVPQTIIAKPTLFAVGFAKLKRNLKEKM